MALSKLNIPTAIMLDTNNSWIFPYITSKHVDRRTPLKGQSVGLSERRNTRDLLYSAWPRKNCLPGVPSRIPAGHHAQGSLDFVMSADAWNTYRLSRSTSALQYDWDYPPAVTSMGDGDDRRRTEWQYSFHFAHGGGGPGCNTLSSIQN